MLLWMETILLFYAERNSQHSVDRYTCRTPHFHMYNHCTDHASRMHVCIGSRLSCVPKIGHPSTRHVSTCASQHTEHQHNFSFTYLSSSPNPDLLSTHPFIHCEDPRRDGTSTEFHSSIGYEPKRIELNRILVNPQNQIIDDLDVVEAIGVKLLSYCQSLIHSAYDWATSIATPPDSDLEDEQLRTMLASPLYIREREENEGQARAYHSERESLCTEARSKCTTNTSLSLKQGNLTLGKPNALFSSEQGNLIRCSVFRNANPSNLRGSLLESNKDHSLNQARSDLAKQELHVESLNKCIGELQRQTEEQRLALQDAQYEFVESRREQVRPQEGLSLQEKVLRNTQIRNLHEM